MQVPWRHDADVVWPERHEQNGCQPSRQALCDLGLCDHSRAGRGSAPRSKDACPCDANAGPRGRRPHELCVDACFGAALERRHSSPHGYSRRRHCPRLRESRCEGH
eukprot:Amastigsp_a175723_107.p5 type:complete len:106 gc:universal Amastigsp_a175723_107:1553-1236(-)